MFNAYLDKSIDTEEIKWATPKMENIWQSKSEIHLWLPIAVINFYQRKVSTVESFKPVQNQLYLFMPYKPTCIQILQTNLNRFPAPFWAERNFF